MGWRGALRAMNAAAKAAERESRRRQKELERERKNYNKMVAQEKAKYEVEEFENYLDRITSFHMECLSSVNWQTLLNQQQPKKKAFSNEFEQKAQQAFQQYTPSIFDKILRRTKEKKIELEKAIQEGKQKDQQNNIKLERKYAQEMVDWKESQDFAKRILNEDLDAYNEVIKKLVPFQEIGELRGNFTFDFPHAKLAIVKINVRSEDIVPTQKKGLLSSGKLSIKNMPKGEFYEYYQDYVCSLILRIAREILALLPITTVVVTTVDDLLNTATGYIEEQVIVSAVLPRKTLNQLNFSQIAPSDSMENFVHSMNFRRTKGFVAVEEVDWKKMKLAN